MYYNIYPNQRKLKIVRFHTNGVIFEARIPPSIGNYIFFFGWFMFSRSNCTSWDLRSKSFFFKMLHPITKSCAHFCYFIMNWNHRKWDLFVFIFNSTWNVVDMIFLIKSQTSKINSGKVVTNFIWQEHFKWTFEISQSYQFRGLSQFSVRKYLKISRANYA